MHELGLVSEIVDSIEKVAKENSVKEIDTLVLEIGEYSGVVPQYVEECYPAVIEDTMLANTKLKVEVVKGVALCHDCGKEFEIAGHEQNCPYCNSQNCEVVKGGEFIIKEIIVK